MDKDKVVSQVTIKKARLVFRNFSGIEGKFNPAGRRSFGVVLDPSDADRLADEGWNVKMLKPRDEDEEPTPWLPVFVRLDSKISEQYRSKVILISGNKKIDLNEKTIAILDGADIKEANLIIRPYIWEVGGKTGIKANVKKLYVEIVEDEFESRYSNIPDSALGVATGDDSPPWDNE